MRKLTSLCVLTLLLSLLTGPAFAGKNEQCEILKDPGYTKGLYGLCNAYWNASEKGKEKVLENYQENMNEGDPGMPGLEPEELTCPCLDALAALNDYDWGMSLGCSSFEGIDTGIFFNAAGIPTNPGMVTFFDTGTDGVAFVCAISQSVDTEISLTIDSEEYDVCLSELLTRCAGGS